MTTLITGGAGYLGSVLALRLWRAGARVRVLDNLSHGAAGLLALFGRENFEFVRGDLREPEARRAALAGVDAVVHLAAVVGDPACAREPELARAVNLDAALALYEEARRAAVSRFVFASTCSNYGRMADTSAHATEETELRPVSLYAETKVAVERALLDPKSARGGCDAVVLRFATLYGHSPRMRFDLTVNQFTAEMLVRRRLTVFGEQFWRPYVHVRDAARAVNLVLDAPRARVAGRVFNVGDTGENYRKIDLVELIRGQVGEADVRFVRRDEDPRDYRVSFERARRELDFQIERRVPDGIAEIAGALRCGLYTNFEDAIYHNTPPPDATAKVAGVVEGR
ncbi:MAG: NAD-dependent epimerase/dehydratase family protein [Pyrinomonadaceae bacterium]